MSATLLPNAKQQFFDGNGTPLAGGSVAFYAPGTTMPKNTWQDSGETILNTNPVILDLAGEALIYGSGQYRQVVKDSNGNLIWDQLTQDAVSASGISTAMQPITSASSTALGMALLGGLQGVNVAAYGAVGDGVTDNSSAFQLALAALPTGGGILYIPPGTYFCGMAITYTMPTSTTSISIIGSGPETTILKFGATDGLSISFLGAFNAAHIRDLSLITTGSNSGVGLKLTQTGASIPNPANTAPSDITNVNIRGDVWEGINYWTSCVEIASVSDVNFVNDIFVGNGTVAYSTVGNGVNIFGSANVIAVVYNFVNCIFNSLGGGLIYGTWTQGVTVVNSNFTGCGVGIDVPAGITGTAQLSVLNTQFNCVTGILSLSAITQTSISNCCFLVPQGADGIDMSYVTVTSIVGNSFGATPSTTTSGNGIIIRSGLSPQPGAVITGNSFYHMRNNAILLDTASINCNVQSNVYSDNTANVTNNGTGNTVGGGSP